MTAARAISVPGLYFEENRTTMPSTNKPTPAAANPPTVVHAVRTAIAAVVSLLVARLLRMPETYWAAITTLIVMQSTLGGALIVAGQRLVGTAMGAVAGALLATWAGPNIYVFGAGVLAMGILCVGIRLDRVAYRYASITLAVIMLVVRNEPIWLIAIHRFIVVSVGIVVALAITAVWPEKPPKQR
jgi:uncharacterized membrane protein YccC